MLIFTLLIIIFAHEKSSLTNTFPLKVNNRNTKKKCEICSKLTIETPEQCSTACIVNFGHISHLF